MTRTLWMSVRFGMSGVLPVRRVVVGGYGGAVGPRHKRDEPVEQVRRIVRACRRLGVVLHREALQLPVGVAELETLDDVVVEADVAHGRDACLLYTSDAADDLLCVD